MGLSRKKMARNRRRKRRKKRATDSTGKEILKSRGRPKPPMVMKDKTKYNRKKKHKLNDGE